MASGLRTAEDALALAGVDFLVAGPKVLQGLAAMPSAQGYNDGLSAAAAPAGLAGALSPAGARAAAAAKLPELSEAAFSEGLGLAGADLLKTVRGGAAASPLALSRHPLLALGTSVARVHCRSRLKADRRRRNTAHAHAHMPQGLDMLVADVNAVNASLLSRSSGTD